MHRAGDLCKQIWSHAEILISHVLKFTDLNCWFWDCKCTVALAKYLLNLFNPTQYNFRFVPFVLTLNTFQLRKFSSRRNTCINYLIFSQLSGRAYPHRHPSPPPPTPRGWCPWRQSRKISLFASKSTWELRTMGTIKLREMNWPNPPSNFYQFK